IAEQQFALQVALDAAERGAAQQVAPGIAAAETIDLAFDLHVPAAILALPVPQRAFAARERRAPGGAAGVELLAEHPAAHVGVHTAADVAAAVEVRAPGTGSARHVDACFQFAPTVVRGK